MAELAVWAPKADRVRVQVANHGRSHLTPMRAAGGGWWLADDADAVPGADYGFLLDDDNKLLPDPRSR